jgi:hypothetical protein
MKKKQSGQKAEISEKRLSKRLQPFRLGEFDGEGELRLVSISRVGQCRATSSQISH